MNVREITNPGADDNASAVAGLLETGRELKEIEQELFKKNLRVDLVAYANEEPPHYHTENMGSYVHAKSLKEEGAKLKGMICYEMIGYFDDRPSSQGYLERAYEFHGAKLPWYLKPINAILKKLYPSTGNFIGIRPVSKQSFDVQVAQKKVATARNARVAFGENSDFQNKSIIGNWDSRKFAKQINNAFKSTGNMPSKLLTLPAKIMPMIEMSDQWSYWKHGFPAAMITDTSFLRNPNYHKITDTPNTLNYSKMAEVVNGVVGYINGYN